MSESVKSSNIAPPALSAPDLIFALLDSARRPELPVGYFVTCAELLEIDPQTVRVALTRLVKQDILESPARGLYRIASGGTRMRELVRGWAEIDRQLKPWHGGWVAIYLAHLRGSAKRAVRARERALHLAGFAPADKALWVRPDNLAEPLDKLRARLVSLGLDPAATAVLIGDVAPAAALDPATLWDAPALEATYQQHCAELAASTDRLPSLDLHAAARETLLLGRAVTHTILTDPLLPDALVDTNLRAKMVARMRDYDRLGKRTWREFFKEAAG